MKKLSLSLVFLFILVVTSEAHKVKTPFTGVAAGGSADMIANTPAGDIVATDVQAAIDELDGDKAAAGACTTVEEVVTALTSDGDPTCKVIIESVSAPPASPCTQQGLVSKEMSATGTLDQVWTCTCENADGVTNCTPQPLFEALDWAALTDLSTLAGTDSVAVRDDTDEAVKEVTLTILANQYPKKMCTAVESVTATDDNMLLGSEPNAITVTGVWCHYKGSAPTTAATFTLADGDGTAMTITDTNPVCAAPTAAATPKAVTANGAMAAYEAIKFSVSNTPNPATDTYEICVSYQYQ